MSELTMDKLVALCKGRGFIFAGSEIYGGLANTWDYGPLGVELKNNIKKAWWKKFVQESPYNVGLDAAILMNPQTWQASGHLALIKNLEVNLFRFMSNYVLKIFLRHIQGFAFHILPQTIPKFSFFLKHC